MTKQGHDPAELGAAQQLEAPDSAAIDSLAEKLEALAATLDEREQKALQVLLYCAMDPLDRIRLRESELFSDEEKALLDGL